MGSTNCPSEPSSTTSLIATAYSINGCGGIRTGIGDGNFGLINGVTDNPRFGQFGFRFEF